jgi:TFIIF-interacting CTD phosphatase-like protein
LTRIGRPLDKTVIVDNMAVNYRNHKENGILIKPYYGNYKNDMALFYLGDILIKIAEDTKITDITEGLKLYKEEIIKKVTSARGWKN